MSSSETPRPSSAPSGGRARWCVVGRSENGWTVVEVHSDGAPGATEHLAADGLAAAVGARERGHGLQGETGPSPRWVWSDTALLASTLIAAGVRVTRCHDLRLTHQILRHAESARSGDAVQRLRAAEEWNVRPEAAAPAPTPANAPTLFDVPSNGDDTRGVPQSVVAALEEFTRQREVLAASREPQRLARLIAAESAGALVAAEMTAAGVPWDAAEHDRILTETLGPRPPAGEKPARMVETAARVRRELRVPDAPLDSPPRLLRVLRAAGIEVASTSRWELSEQEHPAIAPLLHYKKLARLMSANGWSWLDEWVRDGRYRPVYVPGGVVTGRWASSGGGALQIPRQLRPAIRADPGWTLVMADVAQLEPRVLAAMAGDRAMAAAGSGTDLYAGIVASEAVATRQEAKYAVLGAMYGATTGESGRLVPRLRRAYPDAMRLVDEAAERGAAGGTVSTWLGRSSHDPGPEWHAVQAAASLPGASSHDEALARRLARERGRFTRNFIVQGSAAEWALCWLADLRTRLAAFEPVDPERAARASGRMSERRAHLAFFLHDEVIVHAPAEQAEAVSAAVRDAAASAGRLLFGNTPVDFPLDLHVAERASKAA